VQSPSRNIDVEKGRETPTRRSIRSALLFSRHSRANRTLPRINNFLAATTPGTVAFPVVSGGTRARPPSRCSAQRTEKMEKTSDVRFSVRLAREFSKEQLRSVQSRNRELREDNFSRDVEGSLGREPRLFPREEFSGFRVS